MTQSKFAVIGNPIAHSLSPEIHLAFAHQSNIELRYDKLRADDGGFLDAARQFFADGGVGMNVTAPFKGDAFAFVDERDAASQISNSVNTIHAQGEVYLGYNTDGIGLIEDLDRLGWHLEDAKLLMLGAGGAASGILDPLLARGARITVANRTQSKAKDLQSRWPALETANFGELASGWDLIINATAASWQAAKLPLPMEVFDDANCYDLAYQRDGHTPFLAQISNQASACSDGLGMLVEQAAAAFEIWHGVKPDTAPVLQRLRHPKRQFIAGAVCPRCSAIDKIMVEFNLQDQVTQKSCVACGYVEKSDGSVSISVR